MSKRNPGQHVLTMAFDRNVFNYEIKNKTVEVSENVFELDLTMFNIFDAF